MSVSSSDTCKADPLHTKLHALPKVDLHAHLNGSISTACLEHLAALLFGKDSTTAQVFQFTFEQDEKVNCGSSGIASIDDTAREETANQSFPKKIRSVSPFDPINRMHHCFKVFDAIYKVMNNIDFSRVVIQDILFHYLSENAVYIEMRTSLRSGMYATFEAHKKAVADNFSPVLNGEHISTQGDYWKAVTNTIANCLTLVAWSDSAGDDLLGSHHNGSNVIPFLLPAIVSPWPPFCILHPSVDNLYSTYLAALEAWITLYSGSSPSVRAFVVQLRNEAQSVANALSSSEKFHSSPSLTEVPPPSSNQLHLFPSVISAIARLRVRMLISLSRSQSLEQNESTAQLIPAILSIDAEQLSKHANLIMDHRSTCEMGMGLSEKSNIVGDKSLANPAFSCVFPLLVGIDLSGSAYNGELQSVLSILRRLRSTYGLPLTLHGGEKKNDEEVEDMISLGPDRWGHLVFISEKHRERLQRKINGVTAVEFCITSNMVTSGSRNVSEHHIQQWLECVPCDISSQENTSAFPTSEKVENQKFCLSPPYRLSLKGSCHVSLHTDDRGVFNTSMTRELWLLSCHTGIFPTDIFGEINSQNRCDALFPILLEFHRRATEVIFVPPNKLSCSKSPTDDCGYRRELLHHFDSAYHAYQTKESTG